MATASGSPVSRLGERLDRRGATHLYRQIANLLGDEIRRGTLREGDTVPPQRELSAAWRVGEVTVRRALQQLADEGLIEARYGGGTVVRGASTPPTASRSAAVLTLGIAFADLADGYPFMHPLLQGLRDTDRPVAIRMFDLPSRQTAGERAAHLPSLDGLDGLIMMSPVNLPLLAHCQAQRLPCVLLFSDVADGYSRCVVVDYARGVQQSVRHLAGRGAQRVALLTAAPQRFSTGQLLDAYRDAMEMVGLERRSEWVIHAGYHEADGYRATKALLSLAPRPDAILFASDFQARGGLVAAHELGLRVPQDLRVIGAGATLGSEGWPNMLTTINLGISEVGRRAREAVATWHEHTNDGGYRSSVPSELIIGGTS